MVKLVKMVKLSINFFYENIDKIFEKEAYITSFTQSLKKPNLFTL